MPLLLAGTQIFTALTDIAKATWNKLEILSRSPQGASSYNSIHMAACGPDQDVQDRVWPQLAVFQRVLCGVEWIEPVILAKDQEIFSMTKKESRISL